MKFNNIKFIRRSSREQAKLFFDNWYWVSIVRWPWTYWYEEGLYELAVTIGDETYWTLCYNTPITDDVLWYLTEEDVLNYIEQVKALPKLNK